MVPVTSCSFSRTVTGNRDALDASFATWRGGIEVEITQRRTSVGGDTAYVISIDQIGGTKVDWQTSSLRACSTRTLRHIDGEWKIVHEHTSVPFYMERSLKAAVDLQAQRAASATR